jgi:APA family basic amino acid/polyamine antiporter
MLGIGAVIGTGIFVLTAEAGQKAGPAMMLAFVIAAGRVRAGCPGLRRAGFDDPGLGLGLHLHLWRVRRAHRLGRRVGAGAGIRDRRSTVCVGWSGYMNGLLMNSTVFGMVEKGALALPEALRSGPLSGGSFNVLAFLIAWRVTVLLAVGTSKSAKVNAVLVSIKVVALTVFIVLAFPAVKGENFEPFLPGGWGSPMGGRRRARAAASIFFAYVGFDAVSTAPRRPRTRTATSRSA